MSPNSVLSNPILRSAPLRRETLDYCGREVTHFALFSFPLVSVGFCVQFLRLSLRFVSCMECYVPSCIRTHEKEEEEKLNRKTGSEGRARDC